MSTKAAEICVAHLVRRSNDMAALRHFLDSYRRHPAGVPHELLIIFKGFGGRLPDGYEELLRGVPHARRFVPDRGFELAAYFDTARAHEARWFCFLNSYSVILADGWLEKMHRALVEGNAGTVGATGSWQSIASNILDNMKLPPSMQAGYPRWKRVLLTWFPVIRTLWRPVRSWMLRTKFAPFPNYHLRTNAFLIPRDIALRVRVPAMRKKFDAYEFESGLRGFTKQILQMDRPVLVVGRDGTAYGMERWHESNTFWRCAQENLLVADNQTRKYDRSDFDARAVYSMYAWGSAANPAPTTQPQGIMPSRTCLQCGARTERAFETSDINRRIGRERFLYLRCPSCKVVFLANVPKDLGRYYPSDYYFIARSLDELASWGTSERYKLDIILQHRGGGRLIEVGPASGAFAYLAKRAGFDVTAIEMDRRCAEYLASTAGLHVINSADEAKALHSAPEADVIAMWHVIEHLVDPWSMLEVAAAKLRPGGVLVLATPNPFASQFRLFRARWAHVDAPRHLWLIPADVLVRRGAKHGLSLRAVTTRDPGSLFWNRFGWEYSLANILGLRPGQRWASRAGRVAAAIAQPIESREGRGAAYTIVLEKPA